jgi:hypothetical protein
MKKTRKLVLHRETLHSMELRSVADGSTYGYCPNTYENCSYTCTSGGACTLEGSCPTG